MARTSSRALKPETAIQKMGKNMVTVPTITKTRVNMSLRNVRKRILESRAGMPGRTLTEGKVRLVSLWLMNFSLSIEFT
jgi:hypothetical protein